MLGRDGRGKDNQTGRGFLAGFRNHFHVFLIMNQHAFLLQLTGQVAGCLVIAAYYQSTTEEIAGDGTHSDTTGTDEIDCFDIFDIHCGSKLFTIHFPLNLMTSLAMISAESGKASLRMFSFRVASFSSSFTVSTARGISILEASLSFT